MMGEKSLCFMCRFGFLSAIFAQKLFVSFAESRYKIIEKNNKIEKCRK